VVDLADEKFLDIEKYVEDSLVIILRAFFSVDPIFTFSEDDRSSSKVHITASRPKDNDLVKPHAIVSVSGYSVAEAGLSNGFSDVIMNEGAETEKRTVRVVFSSEIMIAAETASESKNFANRAVSRFYLRGRRIIYDEFNINITQVSKGRAGKTKLHQNMKEMFVNSISVSGEFAIDILSRDKEVAGILRHYRLKFSELDKTYLF
jgi:hypothetical protein